MQTFITIFPFADISYERAVQGYERVYIDGNWEKWSLADTVLEPQQNSKHGTRLHTKMLAEYFMPVFTDNIYNTQPIDIDNLFLAGLISKTNEDIYIHPLNGNYKDTIELKTLDFEGNKRREIAKNILLNHTIDVTYYLSDVGQQAIIGLDYLNLNEALIGTIPFYCGTETHLIEDAKNKELKGSAKLNSMVATVLWQKIQHNHNKQAIYFEHVHRKTILGLVDVLFKKIEEIHQSKGVNDVYDDFDSMFQHYNKDVFKKGE